MIPSGMETATLKVSLRMGSDDISGQRREQASTVGDTHVLYLKQDCKQDVVLLWR
jgi:hypothetical protein